MEKRYRFNIPSDELAKRNAIDFPSMIEAVAYEHGIQQYLAKAYDDLRDTDVLGDMLAYKRDFDSFLGTEGRYGAAFLDGSVVALDAVHTYRRMMIPQLHEKLTQFRSELLLEHIPATDPGNQQAQEAYIAALRSESRRHLRTLTRDYHTVLHGVSYEKGYRGTAAATYLQEGCGFMLEMASLAYRTDYDDFNKEVQQLSGEPVSLLNEIGRYLRRERTRREQNPGQPF